MAPHDFDPLPYPFDGSDSLLPTADVESSIQRSLNDLQHCLAAVISVEGEILAVNKRWNEFARAHADSSPATVGANYLTVCDRSAQAGCQDAETVAQGLRSVARGDRLVQG